MLSSQTAFLRGSSFLLATILLSCTALATAAENIKSTNKPNEPNNTVTFDSSGYMKRLSIRIRKHWVPPATSGVTHIVASWTIHENGSVSGITIVKHGVGLAEERSVIRAITAASPFESLPPTTKELAIEYSFDSVGRPKPLGLTVEQAVKKYRPDATKLLRNEFQSAKAVYPPKHVTLICLKDAAVLLLFAKGYDGKMKPVRRFDIVSSSGEAGPKLLEGDMQVPEGFYKITGLNAMTHLAMSVNYPNQTDRNNAKLDHRTKLGGYIEVHGGVYSTGCIVITNDDMAELFLLGHEIGCSNVDLIVVPCDLVTKQPAVDYTKQPKWLPALYKDLKTALAEFPPLSDPTQSKAH